MGADRGVRPASHGGLGSHATLPHPHGHPHPLAMPLLIQNGQIITADSQYRADIFVEDETITRIGRNLEALPDAEVIDASGKLIFPGFIDPHVHVYLPFMATFA